METMRIEDHSHPVAMTFWYSFFNIEREPADDN